MKKWYNISLTFKKWFTISLTDLCPQSFTTSFPQTFPHTLCPSHLQQSGPLFSFFLLVCCLENELHTNNVLTSVVTGNLMSSRRNLGLSCLLSSRRFMGLSCLLSSLLGSPPVTSLRAPLPPSTNLANLYTGCFHELYVKKCPLIFAWPLFGFLNRLLRKVWFFWSRTKEKSGGRGGEGGRGG